MMGEGEAAAAAVRRGTPAATPGAEEVLLQDMFEVTRLERPWGWGHVLWFAYLPLGLVLLPIKLAWIGIWELLFFRLGALLHMNELFFRLYSSPIMFYSVTGWENLRDDVKIKVANHVSEMDIVPCRASLGPIHTITPAYYKGFIFSRSLVKEIHAIFIKPGGSREDLRDLIRTTLKTSKLPILCFPEGCVTNGKNLLKYHKFLFSLGEPVQPISVRVTRPVPVHMDTLCTPVWHNIIWLCLVPWQTWHVKILPAQFPREDETPEQFADRVQSVTSQALGVSATSHMKADKYHLVDARLPELKRRVRNKALLGRALAWLASWLPRCLGGAALAALGARLQAKPKPPVPTADGSLPPTFR
eukprot:TRINITY_DN7199_c0_g1_i1.p1 TRINITY_DN7199_c0_g1~~TRINITY_DN7199_c0_g1_i1.p1  ORF type:complete len:359 (+),score=96.15 TRINITY_DN7199_c0_g1_i1:18-1094(+)